MPSPPPDRRISVRSEVRRYLQTLSPSTLLRISAEDWLGWLLRSIPGAPGFGARHLLHKMLFARLDGISFIYPGARLMHVYGIRAGANLRINSGVFIDARGGLTIGTDVLIGPNAIIVTSQHHWTDPRLPIVAQGHQPAPITIGDDVWIGGGAVLTPGLTVADGTVVGAGAVVTTDTEPYSVVGGVPARHIATRPRADT